MLVLIETTLPAPGISEAASEDAEDLPGIWLSQHFDVGDPFDPFKAAMAWSD